MPVDVDTPTQNPEQIAVEQHVVREMTAVLLPNEERATLEPVDLIGVNGEAITIRPILSFEQKRDMDPDAGDHVAIFRGNTSGDEAASSVTAVRYKVTDQGSVVTDFETRTVKVTKDGKKRLEQVDDKGNAYVGLDMVPVDSSGSDWAISVTPWKEKTKPSEVSVSVAKDSEVEFTGKTKTELVKAFERRERLKKRIPVWGRRILVAAGLYSSIASGGLIDKAVDPFQDARSHVDAVLVVPEAKAPARLDGINLEDFPIKAQQEMQASAQAKHDEAQKAKDSIAQTMEDLDSHQVDGIMQRSEEFKARYKDQLFGEERAQELIDSIGSADSLDSARQKVEEFLSFYGIKFKYNSQELSAADEAVVKAYMQDLVRAFAPLPKDLVVFGLDEPGSQSLRVKEFEFTSVASLNKGEQSGGAEMGKYDQLNHKIVIGIPSHGLDLAARINKTAMPTSFGGGNQDPKSRILHELGHAISPRELLGSNYTGNVTGISPAFAMHELTATLEYQSNYGQFGGPDEEWAEAATYDLDVTKGPTHPDESRKFNSQANNTRLKQLQQIEERFSGYVDYVAANGAVSRQVFDIH